MNYEDKTNRWIAVEVAKRIGKRVSVATEFHEGDGVIIYPHNNEINFDPCNNPSDAWPIIVENKINIEWRDSLKLHPLAKGTGGNACHWSDKNPLRAAMICFLKMNDAEQ